MSEIRDMEKKIDQKVTSWLSDKPVWVWWLSYIALTAILFVVFYIAWEILTGKWWVVPLAVIVTGLVWGSISYMKNNTR